jgi:modulator of FtsH protease HflC
VKALPRTLTLVGAVVTALAVWSCFVVVDVTEHALILRLGRVVRVVREPGLYFKGPYPLESVVRLDRRLLSFRPVTAEFLSDDKKNLVIHSIVTWRITDPERFLATTGDRPTAERRLSDLVLTKIGSVVGSYSSTALVSVEGHSSQFEQVMAQIVAEARGHAMAQYGIALVDIRLRQLSLPEQNRANVFERMRAERGNIAMKYRSEGEREFKKVVAEADSEKTRILAEAYREAERIKAEGDAKGMRIYAEAFGKNPQLYKFRRTLQAYEKILGGNTTIFLPADAEVFRLLGDEGKSKTGRAP